MYQLYKILLRFGEKKIAKKSWDVNVISKLIKTKTNSMYLIRVKFDEAIRPLVLTMTKMSRYVKAFKVQDGNKDQNNILMYFCIDDEKLSNKYKANLLRFKI